MYFQLMRISRQARTFSCLLEILVKRTRQEDELKEGEFSNVAVTAGNRYFILFNNKNNEGHPRTDLSFN